MNAGGSRCIQPSNRINSGSEPATASISRVSYVARDSLVRFQTIVCAATPAAAARPMTGTPGTLAMSSSGTAHVNAIRARPLNASRGSRAI